MKLRAVSETLNACSGCEISILDTGERFYEILNNIEFLHFPLLMDHKSCIKTNGKKESELPEADLGILSGGIRNEEHLEIAKEVRKKCDIVIAFGTCATHGGIPALTNSYTNQEVLSRYYSTETTDNTSDYPDKDVPPLLERCYALDEHIKVDLYFPGCPPHPHHIYNAFISLATGKIPALPEKSVCDVCPVFKKGKIDSKNVKRFLAPPQYNYANEPLKDMRCLLEQGFVCMGPVTRAGCGGDNMIPRCISARVPCQGCYGPASFNGNQRLDLLNALASQGINTGSLPNTEFLLEFSGAHNLLRPRIKLVRK